MGLFVKVGTTQELEALEAGKLVEAAGQRIAIFNVGGRFCAIEDVCPHRGGPVGRHVGGGRGDMPLAWFPIQRKDWRGDRATSATEREEFSGASRRN
jgi:hypothetical protein